MMNRRDFLKWMSAGAAVSAGTALLPGSTTKLHASVPALWLGEEGRAGKTLVVVFQRGAMDGLAAVTPYKDRHLPKLRPNIFVKPGGENGALDLDGTFAMHPSLKSLADLFLAKQLSVIHGAGLSVAERSHFSAQDFMETGTPGRKGTRDGWMNRALGDVPGGADPRFRAVAFGAEMPRVLTGTNPSLTIENLRTFGTRGLDPAVAALYGQDQGVVAERGKSGFSAADKIASTNWSKFQPGASSYPRGPLADGLKQIAMMLKADFPVSLAHVDSGGWDMHSRLGNANGQFARVAGNFAGSIAAFWRDLGPLQDRVILLTLTEFGRTVAENGSGGTDHGRGSCFFVIGKTIHGGKVFGDVPALTKGNLDEGRDLPVTTDYRAVVHELLTKHLQVGPSAQIFPNWKPSNLGLIG